jgi:signal peptidase II
MRNLQGTPGESLVRVRAAVVPLVALVVFVLDQLSKFIISRNFELNSAWFPIPFLKSLFGITYIHNTGAAFGILPNQNLVFSIVALAVVVIIVVYARRNPSIDLLLAISLGLLLGAAAGNLFDRVRHGYVVDFIYVKYWAVSNVADICITTGVILLALYLITHSEQPAAAQTAPAQPTLPPVVDNAGLDKH